MSELWLLVLAASLATYFWRGAGVLLSGRVTVESELFAWATCVAYAMVAGLVSRIVFMPTGMLADTVLADRLAACAVALAAYHLARRNLLAGVAAGVGALMVIVAVRGA